MAETCNLLTLWRPDHKETPEECARQALVLFAELAQIDPEFATFQTTSRKHGKYVDTPVPMDVEGLARLFAKGVNRGEFDRKPIERLGYTLNATTQGKNCAWLAVNGGTSDTCYNSCLLRQYGGEYYERVVNAPTQIQLFHAMVKAFSPQIGCTGLSDFQDAMVDLPNYLRTEFEVDWIMYFSRGWGTVPPLPAPVRIEPVGQAGTLVILTPEPASASNPEDVRLGRQVQALLGKAGLLNLDRLRGGARPTRS